MVNLRIGVMGENVAGWQLLLDQEGIPYAKCTDATPDQYSVVIVADDAEGLVFAKIRAYLSHGGSVLCSMNVFSKISGVPSHRKFIQYVIEGKYPGFFSSGLIDIDLHGHIHPAANVFAMQNGHNTGYCGEYGGGNVVVLPVDAGEVILDQRSAPKSFYADRRRLSYEVVSRVSKGGLRLLVSHALTLLHHRRSLPYVHKWYFPQNAPTIFGWRIDTDYATEEQFRTLSGLLDEYKIPATWFVDVKSQEHLLPLYQAMVGHEIGIHCYEHLRFTDVAHNLSDIKKALEILGQNGIAAHGYAAPYGKWKKNLAHYFPELGIEYSSEFSYDYENVPSFPINDGKPGPALQIPVHPVSIGSLRRQGFDELAMSAYYDSAIEQMVSRHIPVILYHHPGNEHPNVVRTIFKTIRQSKYPVMKLLDYARWWGKRGEMTFSCTTEKYWVHLNVQQQENCWVRIVHPDGREAIIPPSERIDMNLVKWNDPPAPAQQPRDIERVRNFNPWILVQSIEDATIGKLKRR
jgi:peptidoglycan/xylan/chitin deacetylase (PgdA/CDA1 family)